MTNRDPQALGPTDEVMAMAAIGEALAPLTWRQAARVLAWAQDRFVEEPRKAAPPLSRPDVPKSS